MLFGFADKNQPMKVNPTGVGPEGEDDLLDEEDESVGEEITKTLVALMPWGISILFHVALVVVAFFLIWQTIVQAEEEQEVIASTKLADDPGAPIQPQDPKEDASDAPQTTPTDPTVPNPTPVVVKTPRPTVAIGVTARGGMAGGITGSTSGRGAGVGKGPFGSGGNASDVVYVVDATGSMVDILPFVINEMDQVLNKLEPGNKISIIFFSGDGVFDVLVKNNPLKPRKPEQLPKPKSEVRLTSVTNDFKKRAKKWIRLENRQYGTGGRGGRYAEAAIVRALKYEPQVVYVLSDNLTGGGQGATLHEISQEKLMASIQRANDHNPKAQFKTIQFLYEDPLVRAGLKGTLQRMAEEYGGRENYRFIGAEDLKLSK